MFTKEEDVNGINLLTLGCSRNECRIVEKNRWITMRTEVLTIILTNYTSQSNHNHHMQR